MVLGFGMVMVVFIFVYYNQTIIAGLKNDAARVSRAYARLWQYAASEATSGTEINFIFEEIIKKANFPIIVTSADKAPMYWTVDLPQTDTSLAGRRKLNKYLKRMSDKYEPIPIYYGEEKQIIHYLYYGDSELIRQLPYMPYIELSVIAVFVLVGVIGYRNIKRSEQRSIWVGMAKETAHQLGTPLTSLLGWVELLKLKYNKNDFNLPDQNVTVNFDEIVYRMQSDLRRLDRVATRFGLIGSVPELEVNDLNQAIGEVVSYYKLRLPGGGKGVEIFEQYGGIPDIKINQELIGWVIENLIKNSLEAVDPKNGKIFIETKCENNKIIISFADNGRGIPPANQKRIFVPGFSTRRRGWGLGLTLAKRIIDDYHDGKIWLAKSEPWVKTEFLIELSA
jgi:signal transduction histidine kinase